ncbi:hypothetical protein [Streptomyces sp. H27-S2]|uniref:hypothetical protein n=1 Tax=Streptomyces antarcticus TaxID=2996458 RepID=UPI00226D55F9|nr:hypothetical protein [Streptomyces sp. H27-S2]MCY0949033.1 hypothetical protein [Streptomyces sp. H27-S2]
MSDSIPVIKIYDPATNHGNVLTFDYPNGAYVEVERLKEREDPDDADSEALFQITVYASSPETDEDAVIVANEYRINARRMTEALAQWRTILG